MTITSNHVGTSVGENFRTILAEESGEIMAIGFDEDSTREFVEILAESDEPPKARLLVEEDVLKWVRDNFILASTAADLLEADTLEVRAATDQLDGALMVTGERVISLLTSDEHSAALVTDDEEFVAAARKQRNDLWEGGEEFDLRTPAYTRVLDSLAERFSSEMEADFRTALASVESMADDGGLDEVGLSLLLAAKHEQLLYDISRWGEDVGVASKATFSRTKTHLEERGLLETEKVPLDVGRPRLRLLVGDERLGEADAEELVSVARELLSAVSA
ncbi:transcriptional regulator TbsP [Halococcus sediminicola]|uniref:transcriptional regulator TbsP n=1 Tax=Halococcus sediminicola TaxID=1264579 RepID=UPI000678B50B|nr:DUF5821 family protein [Halococcus sediminicola]